MATPTGILDLPFELILHIFSYLDVSSFLSLTSTCKALHKPEFLHEPSYWSSLVRTTFRVANQPVVEQDGERWKKLYKRMLTQTRIYTWGNNDKACLGHSQIDSRSAEGVYPQGRRRHVRRRPHVSWPEKMQAVKSLGVISDLQCGGWSTTLLNAKGSLYTVGVINGMTPQRQMVEPVPLQYPPGFPPPYDRYEPSTAIRQFSAGRAHILALSDSGRIWTWNHIGNTAFHVKFPHHDIVESGQKSGKGVVKKVVAGWNKSGALIEGSGIVLWEPLRRDHDDTPDADTALVFESAVVPNTSSRQKDRKLARHIQGEATDLGEVGEVLNFIVLEEVILFNTHLGKVFVCQITWDDRDQRITVPVELPLPTTDDGDKEFVTDVQGSFTSFAVFTQSGAVLTGKQDRLMDLLCDQLGERPLFTRIPALQHKDVIQLAFGDYHFHALHAPGYITSYGTEPQHCGALGLGGPGGEGRLRGLRYQNRGDARLVPHAYTEGRRVWFQREKRAWIEFLISGGVDPAECMERERMAIGSVDFGCQGEVSEWIEQEGRDWESKLGVRSGDDDVFGAYFAMSVTAAGWHSGALVLVNEELANKMKRACEIPEHVDAPNSDSAIDSQASADGVMNEESGLVPWLVNSTVNVMSDYGRWVLGLPPYNPPATHEQDAGATEQMNSFQRGTHPINYGASPRVGVKYIWADDHFPRLVLSDGTEMPGTVPFDEWRYPRPDWVLDFEL